MEKRKVEKMKYYDKMEKEKHYFPEIMLKKYRVGENILGKLPYIPSME